METDTYQVAAFNENAFKIQRLHNYWLEAARYRHNGYFEKSRWFLDTIEAELKFDARKLDKRKGYKFVLRLININRKFIFSESKPKFYMLLLEKEEVLREVQQEIGMGTTYRDLDEDDMD